MNGPPPQLFNFTKKAAPAKAAKPRYETVTLRPSFAIPTVLLGGCWGLVGAGARVDAGEWTPGCRCPLLDCPLLDCARPASRRRRAGTAAASHFAHGPAAVEWVTGVLGAFLAFQASLRMAGAVGGIGWEGVGFGSPFTRGARPLLSTNHSFSKTNSFWPCCRATA